MDKPQHIRTELESLDATQLHKWHGQSRRPRLDAARLQELARNAQVEADTEQVFRQLGRSSRRRSLPWLAAASVILLLGLGLRMFTPSSVATQPALAMEELDEADILAYVEANIDDFEWDLIEETFESEETTDLESLDHIPETAIESYLEEDDQWLEELY